MEFCDRKQSSLRVWLLLIAAACGTFLLAFVPSGLWPNGAQTPAEEISAVIVRQFFTVLLLLVVPSLWAWLAHRISPWLLPASALFAFGSGLLIAGEPGQALFTMLFAALPGIGLYAMQRMRLSNFRTVIYGAFVDLVALFCLVGLKDLIETGDAYRSFRHTVDLFLLLIELEQQSKPAIFDPLIMREAQIVMEAFRDNAEAYCLSMMATPALAAGLSNTLFTHLWNRNGGADLPALPKFELWRCERGYTIFAMAFMFGTMLLAMFGVRTADALSGIADALWRWPCMLAGISSIRYIGKRFNKGWIMWIAIVMFVLMPPIMGTVLAVLGMLASLRKPIKDAEDGGLK